MLNVPASLPLLRPVVQFVASTRGTKDLQLLLKHLFISQDAVNLIFRCLVDLLTLLLKRKGAVRTLPTPILHAVRGQGDLMKV